MLVLFITYQIVLVGIYAVDSSPTLYSNICSSVLSHIYCFYIICNVTGGISINKGIKDDNDGEMSLL